MFREAVLAFMGVGSDGSGGCTPERKADCEFQYGEYRDFVCKTCEHNVNKHKEDPDAK
jgi:hypothetical protein